MNNMNRLAGHVLFFLFDSFCNVWYCSHISVLEMSGTFRPLCTGTYRSLRMDVQCHRWILQNVAQIHLKVYLLVTTSYCGTPYFAYMFAMTERENL